MNQEDQHEESQELEVQHLGLEGYSSTGVPCPVRVWSMTKTMMLKDGLNSHIHRQFASLPFPTALQSFFTQIPGSLHIHSLALQTLSAKTPLVLADAGHDIGLWLTPGWFGTTKRSNLWLCW